MILMEHWWNGSWGTMTRKDVWLETCAGECCDGDLIQVRWRGGDYTKEDGIFRTLDPRIAVGALVELLGEQPSENGWKRLTVPPHKEHELPDIIAEVADDACRPDDDDVQWTWPDCD